MLTDGIMNDSFVPADDVSAHIDETSAFGGFARMKLGDTRIVAVRHEADILTVGLFCIDKSAFFGYLPRFAFAEISERKECFRELLLRHRIENITLVFCLVSGFFQQKSAVFALYFRIVTRGDEIAIEYICAVEEFFEFHISVAVDAGIRGHAAKIAFGKFIDDFLFEIMRKIENIMRHSEPVGYTARILRILERTAGMKAGNACVLIIIKLHRAADAGMSIIAEKLGGDARINAAAHCHEYFHLSVQSAKRGVER